jgi:hypothetical protein
MALHLPVYIVVSALSLEDRHRQTLIHSDYSILLDLVNQYHSTLVIHMPLQLSIRQLTSFGFDLKISVVGILNTSDIARQVLGPPDSPHDLRLGRLLTKIKCLFDRLYS